MSGSHLKLQWLKQAPSLFSHSRVWWQDKLYIYCLNNVQPFPIWVKLLFHVRKCIYLCEFRLGHSKKDKVPSKVGELKKKKKNTYIKINIVDSKESVVRKKCNFLHHNLLLSNRQQKVVTLPRPSRASEQSALGWWWKQGGGGGRVHAPPGLHSTLTPPWQSAN